MKTNQEERSVVKVLFNKHKNRKNNVLVGGMYEMYKSGKSLDDVAKVYKKTRQAVYDVFATRGYKLRTKELKGLKEFEGFRFTETKGGYLRGTVDGQRVLAHHFVWQRANGNIPDNHVLFFKDGNKKNCELSNLQLIKKTDMPKTFNPKSLNQFTKNKIKVS